MEHTVQIDWQQIYHTIDKFNSDKESLLMIMQDINEQYNFVPPECVPVLAEKLDVPKSLIYSVATFYKTISLEPRGKHIINVCTGTACHVRGAEKIIDALGDKLQVEPGQTTVDGLFTLETVRCLGCCAAGPVIMVNKNMHGGLDRTSTLNIIEDYKKNAS
ncbi:MAG: NADH-quinone oxidoreductase subunit NuoE [Desulfobacterales bacterium]